MFKCWDSCSIALSSCLKQALVIVTTVGVLETVVDAAVEVVKVVVVVVVVVVVGVVVWAIVIIDVEIVLEADWLVVSDVVGVVEVEETIPFSDVRDILVVVSKW